ncbi:hypothetical protein BKA70DRAFT_1431924 [Coprinopsis sp. MPI-PUGE-AT-0042]|nr:hypothetical protein BKA70DRAFT_1431924 [Coprinopsis sp. MPI-PUGE-AT-0042]
MVQVDSTVDLGVWKVDLRRYQPLLSSVLPQTSRLREVALRDVGQLVTKTLVFMGTHAPILRSLSIHIANNWSSVLPKEFLVQGAPSLRVLRLHNCSVQPTPKLLWGLTEFHMHFAQNQMNMTPDDVLAVLQLMPHLAYLGLRWYQSARMPLVEEVVRDQILTLSRLRHITLEGSPVLLHALRVPASCKVDICVLARADTNIIRTLGAITSSCRTPEGTPEVKIRVISNEGFDTVRLCAYGADSQTLPSLSIQMVSLYSRTQHQAAFVQSLVSAFGIDQGQSLYLDCCPAMVN